MDELFLLIKFGIVGATGVVLDFCVTWFLKEKIKVHKYLANSIGFLCAASNNFLWNRLWTYESNDPQITSQYFIFIFVSLGGLAFNNAALWFFHDKRKLPFYLSKILAVFVAMVWNFFGYTYIVFK